MHKQITALLLALLLALNLVGCGQQSAADPAMKNWQKYTVSWFDVFDTVTTVVGYAESREEWDRQMEALHEDLVDYHKLYDIYHSYPGMTNLRDVNQQAVQNPVKVDSRIFDLLAEAVELNHVTHGKMNVALGSVYKIWHHFRDAAEDDPAAAAVPAFSDLEAAAQHGSIEDLVLDADNQTVFLADPEMSLDVGSVGKGYAVEMVARAAEERGLQSALISVGGNLRSIGHKPDGSLWTGGIQNPWTTGTDQEAESPYVAAVSFENQSLVTSGDYQRFYMVDGVRYHHLIDPDTLMPAGYFSSVSVLTPHSGVADCLSTGLFCMSLEEGQALVESLDNVEAMWMQPDGQIVYSSGFEAYLK